MPAPSETSIANAALTLLGERRISSLNENTKAAKTLLERYPEVRDDTLRSHPWNFAKARASLAAAAVAPTWGPTYAFDLPGDCLRVLEVKNGLQIDWAVEGRQILTDLGAPLKIIYTRQVTSAIEMDVMFRQAFAAMLAADVAEVFTGTSAKVNDLIAIAKDKIRLSKYPDGQEHSPEEIDASEWIDAREESGFERTIPTGDGTPL